MSNVYKPLRIGIVEIYSHHVFVHTLASVAKQTGMDVSIYTTPQLHADMVPLFADEHDNYHWNLRKKGESDWRFLRRIEPEIEKDLDLLVINSVQGYRIGFLYFFRPKIRTIVGAGRISEFFGAHYRFTGFPNFRRMLHHNFTRFLMKRMVPRYDGIIIHTDEAKRFAKRHGYNKSMIQMPFSLYKENTEVASYDENEVVRFVVTGSIVASCRDHLGVLDTFERLWDKGRKDIALTILSSPRTPYGMEVLARMEALKNKGYDITFFKGWIAEDVFLEEAGKADFFLSPLNLNYYSCGELTSGIVEVVRQGKPGIYPSGYLPDPVIESSSLFYDDFQQLGSLIEELIADKHKLVRYARCAIENSEHYSLVEVAQRFKQSLDEKNEQDGI